MKGSRVAVFAAVLVFVVSGRFAPVARAAVVVGYNLAGAPGSGTAPDRWPATTQAPGTIGGYLFRGPGIDRAALASGFSADSWDPASQSLYTAAQQHNYFGWSFAVLPGHTASLSSFDSRSAARPPPRRGTSSSTQRSTTSPPPSRLRPSTTAAAPPAPRRLTPRPTSG